MLGGYAGKILWVDLTENSCHSERLGEELASNYLGGKGFGAHLLYHNQRPHTDPLSPDNLLIFATGPLTGTLAPSSAKSALITRSPLTRTFLDSYASGSFASELKYAGYDILVIKGRAQRPTYILIDDDSVSLRDASALWGLENADTARAIRAELGDERVKVISIGPAGERLVKFACVYCDRRTHGRGGGGAVMGSKNLKAIAVRGRGGIRIADLNRFDSALQICLKRLAEKSTTFGKYGTLMTLSATNEAGVLPTRNWREGYFEGADKISAHRLYDEKLIRRVACFGCPVACSRLSRGSYGGMPFTTEGPEYENVYAFGSNLGNPDLDSILLAERLCDEYGLDTISCGVTIGFAMEAYEKGIISRADADGLELHFGNSRAAIELIQKIARREGIGDLLAEGVKVASEKLGAGSSRFAMHIKGMELPAYDPRGMKGQALSYAVADRGGCHLRANTLKTEIWGSACDRFSYEGKARMVKELQYQYIISDSSVLCLFINMGLELDDYARLISSATGLKLDREGLIAIADRIWQLTRAFNCREGFGRADDTLPERLFSDPLPSGASKGEVVDRASFEEMVEEYYRQEGWDLETGRPKFK